MVLDKLDEIQWDDLRDSMGHPVTDVPEWIKLLLSNDEDTRRRAAINLGYSLFPHDQVSKVTLVATPFLIELLDYEEPSNKGHILNILFLSFYFSEDTKCVQQFRDKIKSNPTYRDDYSIQRLERELRVGKIIAEAIDSYIALYTSPNWKTRHEVFRLIGKGPFPVKMWEKVDSSYEHFKAKEEHPQVLKFIAHVDAHRKSHHYRWQWKC
ncbi:MAG: hypothetical protein AAFQ07_05155 [Chloroflexota bacterium]